MSGERIINALGMAEDKYIAEAAPEEKRPRRSLIVKWMSAAACIVLVVFVAGMMIWGNRRTAEDVHTTKLESGETIRFAKANAVDRGKPGDLVVYTRTLSGEEIRALFGDLPVTAEAVYEKNSQILLGYIGSIGDCTLYVETAGIPLNDTVVKGPERNAEINGIPISAGYYASDEKNIAERTINYYAFFILGSSRYYVEQAGPYKDRTSIRYDVAEKVLRLIENVKVEETPTKEPVIPDPQYGTVVSQKTRAFSEKEAAINAAYHALFPDRTDYIAFWKEPDGEEDAPLFWAPESVVFPSEDYTLYSSCRYDWVEPKGKDVFVFIDHARDGQSKAMYVVSLQKDGTVDTVLTVGTEQNHYEYCVFRSREYRYSEVNYLAVESAYSHDLSQAWNSIIIDLEKMKVIWSEDSWYDSQGLAESSNDMHKLLLSGKGFTVYERVLDSENLSVKYEETGFLFFEELLHSEKTRNFTEKEALINAAYHAVFPDRDNYIAYWEYDDVESERIFWAPDGQNCVQEGYVHNSSIRYEWIELGGMYVFAVVDAQWGPEPVVMYVAFVRPDGTLAEVIRSDRVAGYVANHYEYRMFTISGGAYLAVESAYVHQGIESWNSFLISLNEMNVVWNEKEWYGNDDKGGPGGRLDMHKLLLSEDGFTAYTAVFGPDGYLGYMEYEEIGFLSFAELLGYTKR